MAKGNTWCKAKMHKLKVAGMKTSRGPYKSRSENVMGKARVKLKIDPVLAAQVRALAKSRKAAGLPAY